MSEELWRTAFVAMQVAAGGGAISEGQAAAVEEARVRLGVRLPWPSVSLGREEVSGHSPLEDTPAGKDSMRYFPECAPNVLTEEDALLVIDHLHVHNDGDCVWALYHRLRDWVESDA